MNIFLMFGMGRLFGVGDFEGGSRRVIINGNPREGQKEREKAMESPEL
jgi:hypothetical protein